MARVSAFAIPALGHIYPSLPIVAELVRRGDRVIYYCSEPHRGVIEATGAEFRPIPWDFSPLLTLTQPRACETAVEWLRCTESWMPQLLAELKEEAPSYVLCDFMAIWGRYAARGLGLPLALMSSSFAFVPGLMPPFPLMTLLDVGLSLKRARMVLELRQISERLSRRHGVPRMSLPFDMIRMDDGDLVVASTSRLFQPHLERLDDRYHFVGPTFEPRAGAQQQPLPPLDERPLVYVSLGTIFNGDVTLFRSCVQALSDGRYQVIMAIGQRVEAAALGPLPSHIHVFKHAPQLEILKRAAVFITHGGMNSTTEALCHAVPLLVVPQGADQPTIARRVEALGVGRQLRRHSPAQVRKAIDALMASPVVRERCREVRQSLLDAGGYRRAADILQSFAARQPTAATR